MAEIERALRRLASDLSELCRYFGPCSQSSVLVSQWRQTLQEMKIPVVRTKEPTTGQYGQILRDSALTGRLSVEEEKTSTLTKAQARQIFNSIQKPCEVIVDAARQHLI